MNKTVKRYLPMALCFLVVVIATVLLISLMSLLQSKKVHEVYSFDEELILKAKEQEVTIFKTSKTSFELAKELMEHNE